MVGFVCSPCLATDPIETDLIDPLIESTWVFLLVASPTTSTMTWAFTERMRLVGGLMALNAREDVRDAAYLALTTTGLLNLDRITHSCQDHVAGILAKLKSDIDFYERKAPDITRPGYKPTDPDEARYQAHWQAIKKVVDTEGAAAAKAAKDAVDAVAEVRKAFAAKKNISVDWLDKDGAYLPTKIKAYRQALDALEKAAIEDLKAHSPYQHVRVIFTNQSANVVFFVTMTSLDADGNQVAGGDTPGGVPIYPKSPKPEDQVAPNGRRGIDRVWCSAKPGDGFVIRAMTMGLQRDRIRFQPVTTKMVSPDAGTLERGFYYLGYDTKVPARATPITSRWFPVKESYEWTFAGDWIARDSGYKPPAVFTVGGEELKNLAKTASGKMPSLSNDCIRWILPKSAPIAAQVGSGTATVKGHAEFKKTGTTKDEDHTEDVEGAIKVLTEAW
jgi:hypothetical protein